MNKFYRIFNKKNENQFEIIFKEIKNQLEIYYKQYFLTLESYEKESRIQKEKLICDYKIEKEKAEKIYQDIINSNIDNDENHQYSLHISGLNYINEENYKNLNEIDDNYKMFFNLFSKSLLIALYSLNESKLKNIVILTSEKFNEELEEIRIIRNQIIHNDSVLTRTSIEKIKIFNKYKDKNMLNEKEQLIISEPIYLKNIFTLYSNFYEELIWKIDEKQEYLILKNNLLYWFEQIDRNITIENFNVKYISNYKKQIFFEVLPIEKTHLINFLCKININKSDKKSYKIINQTCINILDEFIENEKIGKGKFLFEVFELFNFNNNHNIEICFYN